MYEFKTHFSQYVAYFIVYARYILFIQNRLYIAGEKCVTSQKNTQMLRISKSQADSIIFRFFNTTWRLHLHRQGHMLASVVANQLIRRYGYAPPVRMEPTPSFWD